VDVRVIAATHRDLVKSMATGAFREDLYYRLCDIALEVPPLRARREDIPLLIEHFRARLNSRHGLSVDSIASDVLAGLTAHGWPGNVRELEQVLKEAMILQDGGVVRMEDLRLSRSVVLSGFIPSDEAASRAGTSHVPLRGGG
jgi:DNA-binding NtrC family response regulator